jgi:hypothetical protein
MSIIYKSLIASTSIGNTKGKSLSQSTTIGFAKSASFSSSTILGNCKSISAETGLEAGYAFISWVYDEPSKSAIGTFNYPLYDNANFKLIATDQVKTPDNVPIINPQDRDYNT